MTSQQENTARLPTPPDDSIPQTSSSTPTDSAPRTASSQAPAQSISNPSFTRMYRSEVENELTSNQGNEGRSEVGRSSSLSLAIQERWMNELPEVRERYRREEQEEEEEQAERAVRQGEK